MSFDNFLRLAIDDQRLAPTNTGGDIIRPFGFANQELFESLAPWVRVTFRNNNDVLTVGNASSFTEGAPPDNRDNSAVIKSFEWAAKPEKGGTTVEIEIHDTLGGDFVKFTQRINKRRSQQAKDTNMLIQWGWAGASCGDLSALVPQPRKGTSTCKSESLFNRVASPIITVMPRTISANYEGGKIKFTVEGVDRLQPLFEERENRVEGSQESDENKTLSCRQAIIKMFKRRGMEVAFLRKTNNGSCEPVGFKDGDKPDGLPPAGSLGGQHKVYDPKNLDPYQAALEWIKPHVSTNGRAFVPGYDPISSIPRLIFWEDSKPDCNCTYSSLGTLGTYIVNGGKNSPVISFNPKIKWNALYASATGGNTSTPSGGENVSHDDQPGCPKDSKDLAQAGAIGALAGIRGGMQCHTVSTEHATDTYEDDAGKKLARACEANLKAWQPTETITGDLRVQGDPSFANPTFLFSRSFSLVIINPYHYLGRDNASRGDCGDWIADPIINRFLSNRNWRINGVNHVIKEGSYNTIFKLYLAVPNIDLAANNNIGCKGSGGPKI
jgi:hypothetical protein